jgi:hypothetical protein
MNQEVLFKNNFLLLLVFLFSIHSYSQGQEIVEEKGVVLEKRNSATTAFLPENKRIKVKLLNGDVIAGKFKIVDDNTIVIREHFISLDSIAKIKRRSLISAIFSPLIIAYGVAFITVGVIGITVGGYAVLAAVLIPYGIPMVLIPVISENHRPQKWKYSIRTNPKKAKPIPD